MADPDMWIVIPNWQKFQHYSDRNPPWIKDYLDQHDREEYMELTLALRGLLQDLRRLYAKRDGLVHADCGRVGATLNAKVTDTQLRALNDAGFIGFSASKPLALSSSVKPSNTRGRGNKGSKVCPDCGETLGAGHLETCPRMPRLATDLLKETRNA